MTNFRSFILVTALLGSLTADVVSGQTRRPPAPKSAPPARVEATPTFDTILAAEKYKIYVEVRSVGQVVHSAYFKDLVEPVTKARRTPREFNSLIKWLNLQADSLVGSRMFVASWSSKPQLPNFLVGVELPSREEAKKLEVELRRLVTRLSAPPPTPSPSPAQPAATSTSESLPPLHIQQVGSVLLISDRPAALSELRPRGSLLLTEDSNFAVIRNRFAAEPLFIFVDVKSIEKEDKERQQRWEEERKRMDAEVAANRVQAAPSPEEELVVDESSVPAPQVGVVPIRPERVTPEDKSSLPAPQVELIPVTPDPAATPEDKGPAGPDGVLTTVNPVDLIFSSLYGGVFGGQSKWPDAVGIAIGYESESYVARALLISNDNKGLPLPFAPQLLPGPDMIPDSPSVIPGDVHLFAAASLDYAQIYDGIVEMITQANARAVQFQPPRMRQANVPPPESPFAEFEKKVGIKIKDDLLPLLGNEIGLGISWSTVNPEPETAPDGAAKPNPNVKKAPPRTETLPLVAIKIKDREGVRRLIPKIVEGVSFKGANLLAQSEKRDDTEIVTYANAVSYAFIGDFLILSPDVKTTRHVVDSYLKQNTLSSTSSFRNFTRWQPRQVLGQLYIPSESVDQLNPFGGNMSSALREVMTRLSPLNEPTTYALSRDASGMLHELRVPKNVLLMLVGGITVGAEQAPMIGNEAIAQNVLRTIATSQTVYQSTAGHGFYGSLEQLTAEGLLSKEVLTNHGYRIDLTVSGKKFEVIAVPIEYGTTGKLSFFIDESGVLRAGDHGGGPATLADDPM